MGDVVDLDVVTCLDLDPDKVLRGAVGKLDDVVIVGYDKDGQEYFASSKAGGPEVLWLLERCKINLIKVVEDG